MLAIIIIIEKVTGNKSIINSNNIVINANSISTQPNIYMHSYAIDIIINNN